jgi:hypothetical protein
MTPGAASGQQNQQQLCGNQTRILWVEKGAILLVTGGSMLVTAAVETERTNGILLHEGECHVATRSGWLGIRGGAGPNARYVANVASLMCIDARPGAGWWRGLSEAIAELKIRVALTRRS